MQIDLKLSAEDAWELVSVLAGTGKNILAAKVRDQITAQRDAFFERIEEAERAKSKQGEAA